MRPADASANGEASEAVILSVILLVFVILCVSHFAIRCRPKSKRRYVAIAEEPTLLPDEAIVIDTAAEAEDTAAAEATAEAERAVRAAEAAAQTAARAHRAAMAVQNLAQVRP